MIEFLSYFDYLDLWFLLVAAGYFATNAWVRHKQQKVFTVKIIHKDGTVEHGEIRRGESAEVDALIKQLEDQARKPFRRSL